MNLTELDTACSEIISTNKPSVEYQSNDIYDNVIEAVVRYKNPEDDSMALRARAYLSKQLPIIATIKELPGEAEFRPADLDMLLFNTVYSANQQGEIQLAQFARDCLTNAELEQAANRLINGRSIGRICIAA